jgi:nucleotide-binding universal stress UspA family protein
MKILIAYDGSAYADVAIDDLLYAGLPDDAQVIVLAVVEQAMHAARSYGMVETGVAHVYTELLAAAEASAEEASNRLQRFFPRWNVLIESRVGHAASTILEKATGWPADLIVLGTHGRSGLARIVLGSVSSRVLRDASVSVRVCRSTKHDGPIRLLIGHDGSPEADAALKEVCRRSWPAGTEAQVLAVHEVLVPVHSERIAIGGEVYAEINESERFRMECLSRDAVERLQRAGLIASGVVENADPKEALVQHAHDWNADAIFVGARGLNPVERVLLGSVGASTVAHAPCTVEVVRRRVR